MPERERYGTTSGDENFENGYSDEVENTLESGYDLQGDLEEKIDSIEEAIESGDIKTIQNLINYLIENYKDNDEAFREVALLLSRSPYNSNFIPLLEKIQSVKPNDEKITYYLALLLIDNEYYNKATTMLKRTIELNSNNVDAHINLGYVLNEIGNFEDAIPVLEKAMELDPGDIITYENLGRSLIKTGQIDRAITVLEKATELDPSDSMAFYKLGIALYEANRIDEAIKILEEARELNPSDQDIINYIGYIKNNGNGGGIDDGNGGGRNNGNRGGIDNGNGGGGIEGGGNGLSENSLETRYGREGEEIDDLPPLRGVYENIETNVSDVEQIYRRQAEYIAEERLRQDYANTSWYNIFGKAKAFFNRDKIRERYIEEEMQRIRNESESMFGNDVSKASDRFQYEIDYYDDIEQQEEINNEDIDNLSISYIFGEIDDDQFINNFVDIIRNLEDHTESLSDIRYKGTNILERLKPLRDEYEIINRIIEDEDVTDLIRYFEDVYIEVPIFASKLNDKFYEVSVEKLNRLKNHYKSLFESKVRNLNIKLKVFTGGSQAYEVSGEDRRSGKLNNFANWLDNHPWLTTAGTIGTIAGGTATTGGVLGAVGGTLAGAGIVGGIQSLKKRGHFTKEQKGYEDRKVRKDTQHEDKINDLQERIAGTDNSIRSWFLQRRLNKERKKVSSFDKSTQKRFVATGSITDNILDNTINYGDYEKLEKYIIIGLSRLDFYNIYGHNFLRIHENNKSRNELEEEYRDLYKAIDRGIEFLGVGLDEIRQTDWYRQRYNKLREEYQKSFENFGTQRNKESVRSGVLSASIYAGAGFAGQYLFSTGSFVNDYTKTNTSVDLPSDIENNIKQDNVDLTNRSEVENWLINNGYNVQGDNIYSINKNIVVDPDIKSNLENTLGAEKYQEFINNISSKTSPNTMRETLVNDVFGNEKVGNEAKNEIMKYILEATENGKSEVIQQAFNNGMEVNSNSIVFQDTVNKLKEWGYTVSNPSDLADKISGLKNGNLQVEDLSTNEKTLVSEFCWDYIHRDGQADGSPLWKVFFDKIKTEELLGSFQQEETFVSGSSPWYTAVGLPSFWNTFLSVFKREENGSLEDREPEINDGDAVEDSRGVGNSAELQSQPYPYPQPEPDYNRGFPESSESSFNQGVEDDSNELTEHGTDVLDENSYESNESYEDIDESSESLNNLGKIDNIILAEAKGIEETRRKNTGKGVPTGKYEKYAQEYHDLFYWLDENDIHGEERNNFINHKDIEIAKRMISDYMYEEQETPIDEIELSDDKVEKISSFIEETRRKNIGKGVPTGKYEKYAQEYKDLFKWLDNNNIHDKKRNEYIRQKDREVAKRVLANSGEAEIKETVGDNSKEEEIDTVSEVSENPTEDEKWLKYHINNGTEFLYKTTKGDYIKVKIYKYGKEGEYIDPENIGKTNITLKSVDGKRYNLNGEPLGSLNVNTMTPNYENFIKRKRFIS